MRLRRRTRGLRIASISACVTSYKFPPMVVASSVVFSGEKRGPSLTGGRPFVYLDGVST